MLASIAAWRASQPSPWYRDEGVLGGVTPPSTQADSMEPRILAFCGNCHAMPSPQSFPRDAWHDEVLRGYEFYARSGMTHLDPPPVHAAVDYFRSRAPQQLVFSEVPEATTPLRAKFTVERRTSGRQPSVPPALAHLRWARLRSNEKPVLLTCDMCDGNVAAVNPNQRENPPTVLARLDNPCHVEPCDLDGDGTIDLVVADLGSSVPYDHDLGRVVWLRPGEQPNTYEQVVIASGLGRVADVRPGDLDGDGDVDLVVAEFGLHRTGQVLLLQNTPGSGGVPEFRPRQIDPRPGAIHVPIVDLNGDGRLDFVGLISQEYECVEAYMNRDVTAFMQGGPMFVRERLWTGPDLTFGSSGIEPVDLDQDGDVDVLYTNGDAFDNNYANPSHGIQWLENLGDMRFAYHRLTDFIGVCRALAGDVDLDGDLDIVAVAWLPEQIKPASFRDRPIPSVICLEQTEPGVFVRHTLEVGTPRYAALELADFDEDGDLDFAVGTTTTTSHPSHWLAIWWNGLK
jgi:hypothetical protein